jgi:hypothetical protein
MFMMLFFINDRMPDIIIKHCILFVMRKGITLRGRIQRTGRAGRFRSRCITKRPFRLEGLLYLLCGESGRRRIYKNVNGISGLKNFCIIKIWMAGARSKTPNFPISLLSINGCLFKTHAINLVCAIRI